MSPETNPAVRVEIGPAVHPGAWTATLVTADGRRLLLHSRRNPAAEAIQQLGAIQAHAPDVLVVFGMGLGFAVEAARARWPSARIVAFESIAALADAARARVPALFADPNVTVLTGPYYPGADTLWRIFRDPAQNPSILAHPVIARELPGVLMRMEGLLTRARQAALMNAHARRENAGRYLLNTLKNTALIDGSGDVAALDSRFAGVPAVIAAAGPSLNRNLQPLRDVSDRALLIAADTAWRPLVDAGLDPPVVVAVDPTPANGRHLQGVQPAAPTWLLAEGSVDPAALAACEASVSIWRVGNHQPWPWLATSGVRAPVVRVWGSVLTAALDLALRFGCDPIVFIGADLAYTDGRPYCRGTSFERDWADLTAQGMSLRHVWQNTLSSRPVVQVPDVNGRPTPTGAHLLEFRDWIIARTVEHRDRKFVNATEAGILFGGTCVQAKLAEALAGPSREARGVRAVLEEALRPWRAGGSVRDAVDHLLAQDWTNAVPSPAADWIEFTEGRVTGSDIRAALAESRQLHRSRRQRFGRGGVVRPVMHAADRVARVRALLTGDRTVLEGTEPGACGDDGSPAEVVDTLLSTAGALIRHGAGPAMQIRPDLPVSAAFAWTESAAPMVDRFEELLVARGQAAQRTDGFWSAPIVPVEADRPGVAYDPADPDTTARLLIVAQWMQLDPDASVDRLTSRMIGAAATALASSAGTDPATLHAIVVEGIAPTARRVPLPVDAFTRALTGAVVSAGDAPAGRPGQRGARFTIRCDTRSAREPRARLFEAPADYIEPVVLTDRGLPRAWWCAKGGAGSALITPGGARHSFRLSPDGGLDAGPDWPHAISGEMAWGSEGGAVAWNRRERLLMLRERNRHPATVVEAPFMPAKPAVCGDGTIFWCAHEGGLWSWTPGSPPSRLADTEGCLGIRLAQDRIVLDPVQRNAAGVRRRRLPHRWIYADGAVERVESDALAQCAAEAMEGGWTAEAYPFSDVVAIATPSGRRLLLGCYAPLSLAWVGAGLLVATLEGSVLLFPAVRDRIG